MVSPPASHRDRWLPLCRVQMTLGSPAGKGSLTATLVAVLGPLLLTVMV